MKMNKFPELEKFLRPTNAMGNCRQKPFSGYYKKIGNRSVIKNVPDILHFSNYYFCSPAA